LQAFDPVRHYGIDFPSPVVTGAGCYRRRWNWYVRRYAVMSVNPFAPIEFVRELLPLMFEQKESHVLNVCSVD
jgi:hypothetical protein